MEGHDFPKELMKIIINSNITQEKENLLPVKERGKPEQIMLSIELQQEYYTHIKYGGNIFLQPLYYFCLVFIHLHFFFHLLLLTGNRKRKTQWFFLSSTHTLSNSIL